MRQKELPPEFEAHKLSRQMTGYSEFYLRDTLKNKKINEINDVLVVYTMDEDELVLTGGLVGSHNRLFPGQNQSKSYRKMINKSSY